MRRGFVLVLIVATVLAACGDPAPGGGNEPTTGAPASAPTVTDAPPAPADATPGTTLSACEVVAPADVEAAAGLDAGSVSDGVLTVKGTVLDPAQAECRYEGDDWGGLVVTLVPTDGMNTYDAVVKTFGDTAEILDIGDGAAWFEANKRGYFLHGSVMVLVQFTHLSSAPGSFRDATIAVGQAAIAKI